MPPNLLAENHVVLDKRLGACTEWLLPLGKGGRGGGERTADGVTRVGRLERGGWRPTQQPRRQVAGGGSYHRQRRQRRQRRRRWRSPPSFGEAGANGGPRASFVAAVAFSSVPVPSRSLLR